MRRNFILTPYLVWLFLISAASVFMAEVQDASADILDPDLVIYFDYEDFNADTVVEKSGYGYDGKIDGDVTQSDDGKFGKAAHFASGSFLDLNGPNVKAEDIPTEGMSIVAWINVESVTDMAIFNARAGDNTWLVHPEARGDGNYRWLNRSPGAQRYLTSGAAKTKRMNGYIMPGPSAARKDWLSFISMVKMLVKKKHASARLSQETGTTGHGSDVTSTTTALSPD